MPASGIAVEVRRADADDPLAGVVRCSGRDERPVDVIVGRGAWQRRAVERASALPVAGRSIPVVLPRDLVLLKLYAGGPQDAWDVAQLVALDPRASWIDAVAGDLGDLPAECASRWLAIRDLRGGWGS